MRHPMICMMLKTYRSRLDFDATVEAVQERAVQNGWHIPSTFDLHAAYHEADLKDMTRCKVIYFCDPASGYDILQNDLHKPMSVMMPTSVTVYETNKGEVHISHMNFDRMQMMFWGTRKHVLKRGADRMTATFLTIGEPIKYKCPCEIAAWLMPIGLLALLRRRRKVDSLAPEA